MASYVQFIDTAMKSAEYEKMEEGGWFAFIPGLDGLWATGPTIELARKELQEALDGWIEVTINTSD